MKFTKIIVSFSIIFLFTCVGQSELYSQTIRLAFPNAFRPNIDGQIGGKYDDDTIDVFHPTWEGVFEFRMQIYNRRGQLVFDTEDIKVGWDGYYENKLCPQDGYFWRVGGKYENGEMFFEFGEVILLH